MSQAIAPDSGNPQTTAPLILALDTSTDQGGVAVLRGLDALARRTWVREKSHSEFLTSTIESCLSEAGVGLARLERIAVGIGPGSFTGIRVAVNAARSLAFSLGIGVYAFDTMQILAAGVSARALPLLVLVNAHKNLLYGSRFEPAGTGWKRTHGPAAWTLDEIQALVTVPHVCVGDGYAEFTSVLPEGLRAALVRDAGLSDYPQPEVLGRMAAQNLASPLVWNHVQALYIRASEAEEKLREKGNSRPEG